MFVTAYALYPEQVFHAAGPSPDNIADVNEEDVQDDMPGLLLVCKLSFTWLSTVHDMLHSGSQNLGLQRRKMLNRGAYLESRK